MSAENALDCHLTHVILASKCKALKVPCLQHRWTHVSTITSWTKPIWFSFTHSHIPAFPSLLISLPKLPQKRDQVLAEVSACKCCQQLQLQAVLKAEMQTLALNGELDLNCKKVWKKKIKHKALLPILPTKENTSVALQSLLPRHHKYSVSYLRLPPHKLSTQPLTRTCWTKLG